MNNLVAANQSLNLDHLNKLPNIAKDVAIMQTSGGGTVCSLGDIAYAYGVSLDELDTILELPAFKSMLQAELTRYEDLGPSANLRLKSEALAADLQEKLYAKALTDKRFEPQHQLKLLELLLKNTQAADTAAAQKRNEGNSSPVSVTIHFANLQNPKLDHLKDSSMIIEADSNEY